MAGGRVKRGARGGRTAAARPARRYIVRPSTFAIVRICATSASNCSG